MKKIKAFLYIFANSLANPKYYLTLNETKFGFSVKYVLGFILTLTLAVTIFALAGSTAVLNSQETKSALVDGYNEVLGKDTIFNINETGWTTNAELPIEYIQYEKEENSNKYSSVFYLEIYDDPTSLTTNIESLQEELPTNEFIYLSINKDTIFYLNTNNGDFQEVSWEDLTPALLEQGINQVDSKSLIALFETSIPYFVGIITIFSALTMFFGTLIYIFLSAAIIGAIYWIMSIGLKAKIDYEENYRMALHTRTAIIIIAILLGFAPFEVGFWTLFAISVLYGVAIYYQIRNSKLNEA
jgi:hypothetical protein